MKYMGGKGRISREILPVILKNRNPDQFYVEPFAGGMNVVCQVDGQRIASDSNYYLIEMWSGLVDGWKPPEVSRDEYVYIRDNKDRFDPCLVGWVGYNCSYSGKWFGGFAGKTRTSSGSVRDYQAEARKNVSRQLLGMRGVSLRCCSYNDLVIPESSVVYCDPPYNGVTGYGETFDHCEFWDWVRGLCNLGHDVYVSEYDAPDDFVCVWEKEVSSSLSANGICGSSKKSVERLFRFNTEAW